MKPIYRYLSVIVTIALISPSSIASPTEIETEESSPSPISSNDSLHIIQTVRAGNHNFYFEERDGKYYIHSNALPSEYSKK